ncbi:MAG: ThuA domain-containing protein [Verrucomicrobia bacterium]|nr:ThuA domain-containing protein [Verrucomicrobiota bacterium]
MKTLLCSTLLLTIILGGVTGAAAADAAKLKVLVVTGGHGFEKEPFLQVFRDHPEITFTHASHSKTNASAYERDDLLTYDAVVLYDMPKDITDAQKAKFLSLFDRGVGLVVLHHALVPFQHWPDYERIIGGRYPESDGKSGAVTVEVGYQHDVDLPVTIVAKDHPVTAGLKDFTIHDEIYWGFRVAPDVTPLITTTHPKSGKPLGWTRTQGKSRVVYLALGHDHAAYENPNYRRLVAQSIRWAANKSVRTQRRTRRRHRRRTSRRCPAEGWPSTTFSSPASGTPASRSQRCSSSAAAKWRGLTRFRGRTNRTARRANSPTCTGSPMATSSSPTKRAGARSIRTARPSTITGARRRRTAGPNATRRSPSARTKCSSCGTARPPGSSSTTSELARSKWST